MNKPGKYIVVDDFYRNPDKVREFALQTKFDDNDGSQWMGSHATKRAPGTRETLMRISSVVSKDHVPNWDELDAMYKVHKRIVCGGFSALFQRQLGAVHAHGNAGDYIGLVCLSNPNDCKDRKAAMFFRHRQTGMEALGTDIEVNRAIYKDRFDYAKWQVMDAVDMKYNRLVLFDSRYFHGPSPGFGTHLANSRLIQVFCFTLQPRSVYNEHP